MIRIAISQAAFDAISATLAHGSVAVENQITEHGERLIWLELSIGSGPCAVAARASATSS